MNNLFSKSANRLLEKSSNTPDKNLMAIQRLLQVILKEQRLQRGDLSDLKLMVNKVLIDKHLQMQVDEYFTENSEDPPELEDK